MGIDLQARVEHQLCVPAISSAWNSYHHFTEEIFRIPFVFLPLVMLINVNPGTAPIVSIPAIVSIHILFIHSCTRVHFGWFRYVATDNRYHRIHHSLEPHHIDKNFAAFSSIWDLLFRTAYFPRPNEWPDTGLADTGEPRRLSEYLWQPFRAAKHGATATEPVGFRATLVARPLPCNIAPDTEGNAT